VKRKRPGPIILAHFVAARPVGRCNLGTTDNRKLRAKTLRIGRRHCGCRAAKRGAGFKTMPTTGIETPMYCCEVRWRELRRFCEGGLEPNILLPTGRRRHAFACPDYSVRHRLHTAKVLENPGALMVTDGSLGKLWESVSGNNKGESVVSGVQVNSYEIAWK
jgi:hypothetical protein